ncbi:MAG: Chaperone protein HtpG [Chloroflexi bacterium ADurb.Bin325]|nr:MAG: Chaperone protein HtpG [Chloroflexi bacterium ADurb.Bin325]
MTDETRSAETLQFRAEVQQLLNILAHSLYTEREIFLRELISNASDALNRLQFEMLTNRDVLDPDLKLEIRVDFDDDAHTLTIADTGIGMTRDEIVENLGTIAHSGALAFLKQVGEAQQSGDLRVADIIGQFGVGFYSVFMVADEVSVTTRSYRPEAAAWRWISRGDNQFTLEPADKATRGTTVEIKLKEDAHDLASSWRLESIIKRHSNYVSFPIFVKDVQANQQAAPWRKPPKDVTPEEYDEFYRQLTFDLDAPLLHAHIVTDAPVDIRSILYVPAKLDRTALNLRSDHGLRLYSRKILIQEHNKDLLPEHLRFVEGVVDSEDLPLNISRETVQSSRVLRQIQKVLAGRVIKALRELADEKPEEYARFWQEHGIFIKQGVGMNPGDNAELLPLLRFPSTRSDSQPIALAEYAGRMIEGQTEIYYLLGNDLASAAGSPHLDPLRARGLEALLLTDPFDGYMVQGIREFEGKTLRNVDDPGLELPGEAKAAAEDAAAADTPQADFAEVLARVKLVLGDRVTEVRESKLLTDSPARLVSPDAGFERDMQRVRRLIEDDFKVPPKILELNRRHPLVRNLAAKMASEPASPLVDATIELLFENLLLLDGLHPNPAQMAPRIQMLLEAATR